MATLTIRNLCEATRRALKERAARHHHWMEDETCASLDAAIDRDSDFVTTCLHAAEGLRGDFEAVPRSSAREIDRS